MAETPASKKNSLIIIGLERMGANMARRLARGGFEVHGVDPSDASRTALADEPGITTWLALDAAVAALAAPRIVWLMVAAGEITDQTLGALQGPLDKGDIVVAGHPANPRDPQRNFSSASRLLEDPGPVPAHHE